MSILSKLFPSKDYLERGKKIIAIHKGKYTTYYKLLGSDPHLAELYLDFVGRNPDAVYIRWDKERKRFTA
ncbi:MAG: hypothetical protein B7C24_00955 [Bacteroidetes bacterium 4572_77]|nr:MAG: hypothetical protein B7C24_00955 [Bacteroidetes bacterium 4572_77]